MVDRHLAGGRDYMLESGFSAVDTNVGWSVVLGRSFLGLDPFVNARAYVARLEERPAFRAALADAKLPAARAMRRS